MDLLIKKLDGTCETVTENLEDYDLEKSIAAGQIILDIKNEMKRISDVPEEVDKNYEVVDMCPGLKIEGATEAYDIIMERMNYWKGQCVSILDEIVKNPRSEEDTDDARKATQKAMTWQDRMMRVVAGAGAVKYVIEGGLHKKIFVQYKNNVVDEWSDR